MPKESQELDELTSRLLIEEDRIIASMQASEEEKCADVVALAAKSKMKCFKCEKFGHFSSQCRSRGEGGTRSAGSGVQKCHFCGIPGHQIRNCRIRLSKLNTGPRQQDNTETNAFINVPEEFVATQREESWYLDSGTKEHMCNTREAFKT